MSDPEVLDRIKSFLAAPAAGRRASYFEVAAWEDFFQIHDALIRTTVQCRGPSHRPRRSRSGNLGPSDPAFAEAGARYGARHAPWVGHRGCALPRFPIPPPPLAAPARSADVRARVNPLRL